MGVYALQGMLREFTCGIFSPFLVVNDTSRWKSKSLILGKTTGLLELEGIKYLVSHIGILHPV